MSGLPDSHDTPGLRRRQIGVALGGVAFLAMVWMPAPEALSPDGWRVAALTVLMAVWWVSEAIPVYATALLPLGLLPLLGVGTIGTAAAPYANPLIFLFMGGFMIALAMQRWDLHRRIALHLLRLTGTRQRRLIGGFMLASALLSMWVSNTATATMLLPIGISVSALINRNGRGESASTRLETALFLGIAYGCSIGGLGTLIGTPPNAMTAAFFAQTYGYEIGFAQWMVLGVPLSLVLLLLAWLTLTRLAFSVPDSSVPGADEALDEALAALGPVSRGEWIVGAAFLMAALLWILRPVLTGIWPGLGLTDAGVAIVVALSLFLLPVDLRKGEFVLDWEWARRLPWGVLILFGGGLSLATAIRETGLAEWTASGLAGAEGWPHILLFVALVAMVVFLTELTSNTATTAALLPLLASLAIGLGENPMLFAVPAAIAASCAFMMPVATPPNAIVFGSGKVTIPQMVRAGLILNLIAIVVITAFAYGVIAWALGIEPGVVPEWALSG